MGVEADDLLDLLADAVWLGAGQVDFVDDGDDLQVVMDQSVYVRAAIKSLVQQGVFGALLAGGMILVFLGSFRSTLVAVLSILLSIMAAVPQPTVSVACERNGLIVTACRSTDFLLVSVSSPVSMFTPLIGQLVGTVNVSSTARVTVNQ